MSAPPRYTAWNDEAVDAFVHARLTRIVEAAVAQAGGALHAILLAGGFGRGEGGVLKRADGSLHVINDFDLELVYREPLGPLLSKLLVQMRHRRALNHLAETLAAEFGMKQVDLTLRGRHTLDAAVPKLVDFDLRYGHQCLWGEDPCPSMRAFAPADIPAFEGTWLLRNRGIGLVLARLYLDRGRLHEENVENFYIEINKAALAMGDALWILAGRYQVHYAARAAQFESLRGFGYPRFGELLAAYREAAEYKLRPVLRPYTDVDPMPLWDRTAALFRDFFLWFEATRLKRAFGGLEDYAEHLGPAQQPSAKQSLRRWIERRLGISGDCPEALRALKYQPELSVLFVAALIGARVGDAAAMRVLQQRWPLADHGPGGNWHTLARGLLSAMHPGGEVGRFLAASRSSAPLAAQGAA